MAKSTTKSSSKVPGTGKTIAVIVLLFLFYPIGVVLMAVWMRWHIGIKIAVAIIMPFILLFLLGIISSFLVAVIDPLAVMKKANLISCKTSCNTDTTNACVTTCLQKKQMQYR